MQDESASILGVQVFTFSFGAHPKLRGTEGVLRSRQSALP